MHKFKREKVLWKKGFIVIGVDEVGRGSLAGPIVASAVAFTPLIKNKQLKIQSESIKINDSKKLTSLQRERSAHFLRKNCTAHGFGVVSSSIIDRVGIANANIMAMRKAIYQLISKLEDFERERAFVLSDYYHIPYLRGITKHRQEAIVKGDQKCFSIAAASIIAKVERDKFMTRAAGLYPAYQW
ncbi:MAG: ribonuclease HII, partial [Candidatus Paceibacterota bacterium]